MAGTIAASGIGAVAFAAGLLVVHPLQLGAALLAWAMLTATMLALLLAYYSIHVGALALDRPMAMADILLAFPIVASQCCMAVWLGNVVRKAPVDATTVEFLLGARHWFGLFSCFALTASMANFYSAWRRRDDGQVRRPVVEYESAQRMDRRGAFGCSFLAFAVWVAFLRWDVSPLAAGGLVTFFIGAMTHAFVNQSRTARAIASK